MPPDDKQPSSERQHTDDSLRTEREKADRGIEDDPSVDETADAVITRARQRADQVLAAARAKTDRRPAAPELEPGPAGAVDSERRCEDRELREERARADETLRLDRAAHVEALASGRDETDKDLSSERERADQALALRDEFMGIVSHELRNQLNTMNILTSLIAAEVLEDDHTQRVLEHAQRIQRAAARMGRLLGDLVDVASIDAGRLMVQPEPSDPAEVVTDAAHTFEARAAANQISLVTEIIEPVSPATLDSARILQVLINLLSNAIKFTPPKGKVTVRAERQGTELRFSVTDTGEGVPADKLEAIFERFFQVAHNDRRGLGLGLYISKCIVQGHGGRIWAESRNGKGSTFVFTIPSTPRSSHPTPAHDDRLSPRK